MGLKEVIIQNFPLTSTNYSKALYPYTVWLIIHMSLWPQTYTFLIKPKISTTDNLSANTENQLGGQYCRK